MAMLSRRSMLIGALSVLATAGSARAIGTFGATGLWEALASALVVEEGSGPDVYMIVTPGCDKSGELWEASRAFTPSLTLRWLPVVDGLEDHRSSVGRALEAGSPAAMAEMLLSATDATASPIGLAAADMQEALYQDRLARMLWESTGKTPAMPTMVFRVDARKTKVVRGAIGADRFAEVIDEAWFDKQ